MAAVAGRGALELIVGPAGTGKTTTLASAAAHLHTQGRPAFGVAPAAAAAEVLATETGMTADTLDKLLIEHHQARPPGTAYDLPAGTTIIVDEAGTAPTPKLAELTRLADQQSWRVVLVGDPRQSQRWDGAACSPTSSTCVAASNSTRSTVSATTGNAKPASDSVPAIRTSLPNTSSGNGSTAAPTNR